MKVRFGNRVAVLGAVLVTLCLLALPAQTQALTWAISGPGTTSVSNSGQTATGNYSLSGFSGSWTMSTIAPSNNDITIDWNYEGFHSFFQVTAFLDANPGPVLLNVGPSNCCTSPSAGFNHSGQFTFTGLTAGQPINFTFGGSHFDSSRVLQGTLKLTHVVPEPATIALLGMSVTGLLFRRRNRAA